MAFWLAGRGASTSALTLSSTATQVAARTRLPMTTQSFSTTAPARLPPTAAQPSSTLRAVPAPREPLTTPAAFVSAVAAPRRGDLAGVLSALGGQEASWDAMFQVDSAKLKAAGVNTKERRYFLWALEKYRQGYAPTDFAHDIKPKKKVRGWGPRVQNGIRVRGRRRPGER